MSLTLGLLADALTRSLKEGHVADSLLDRALVEPYGYENGDPARLIVDAGEASGVMELLRRIIDEKISALSLVQMRTGADPAHALMRANTLFDLARSLFVEVQTPGREQVVKFLEQVWQEHIDWRKAAGETFQRGEELLSWVDPATTAEESLLVLAPKAHMELKIKVQEITALDKTIYPAPMADYACYAHLVYAVTNYKKSNNDWLKASEFIFGRRVAVWIKGNRFLLDHVLFHAMAIVHEDDEQKKQLADCLERSAIANGLKAGDWSGLVKRCKHLRLMSDKILSDSVKIPEVEKSRHRSLHYKFGVHPAMSSREAVCAL